MCINIRFGLTWFVFFQSDMYSLGIILFELYNCFSTGMERSLAISKLREQREMSPGFSSQQQQQPAAGEITALGLKLTSRSPSLRPSSSLLLRTSFTPEHSERIQKDEENYKLRKELQVKEVRIQELLNQVETLQAKLADAKNN